MRQTTIYDFINDLQAIAEEMQQEEIDETPTKCDEVCEEPVKPKPSPIETMISGFIANMTEAGQIPSLEQTQSIILLDALVSKYRG